MASQTFFLLAIFCGIIFLISGQIVRDDDSTTPVPARAVGTKEILLAYSIACNRAQIELDKIKCASTLEEPDNVTYHIVDEQNQMLLESLIHSYVRSNESIPDFEPVHAFKLLAKTLDIYRKLCPEVSPKFIDRVEYLFKVLHYRFASTRSEYFVDVAKDVPWIESILETCSTQSQPLHFMMDPCKDAILGRKTQNMSFICTTFDEETNYQVYDPILDSIWNMINAIRAGCFKYFHGSYLMWHRYFLALMDTFAPTVQIRWNAQLEKRPFWGALLGPRYRIDLSNMEKCSRVIRDDSELKPFNISIGRGQFVAYVRMLGAE